MSQSKRAPRRGEMRTMPLRLSAASNGLQFSSSTSLYQPPRSLYLYTSTDAQSTSLERRLSRKYNTNARGQPIPDPKQPQYQRRAIASLIPPTGALPLDVKRKFNKNLAGRRLSCASSIHSTTSSFRSRKRKYYEIAQLTSMPCEILDEIFQHLDQPTLLMLMSLNKHLADSAIPALYAKPIFNSSYRFAQFVSAVTHNSAIAPLVKEIDLSNIATCVDEETPLAGWREWKYRSSTLHTLRRTDPVRKKDPLTRNTPTPPPPPSSTLSQAKKASTHPAPSPFLKQYSLIRDVPLGGVLHVLGACPLINKIDLSNVPLAADYCILPAASKLSGFHPTAFTGLIFVSDVPKAYTWRPEETKSVQASTDLVNALTRLTRLQTLNVKNAIWINKDVGRKLVTECPRVKNVDFSDCGPYKGTRWATGGPREKILSILNDTQGDKSPPHA